ncbi:glycosyltransferase [Paludibacter jiangxiensis]|uniref:Glycosyl transferase family 2 n=1 Tax=Paludibacter jiangxiensis TaxID=681398 RepID=A0A170Z3H8_9BACT|nr:glycosyltransferase [Paludibacter jiangxiensis]GAT62303.1 glycosyl transferase family 2 [Paludibacter jiangxiensis]
MDTPFSVLISLYVTNDPFFFEQAMTSIFEQTYPPTEVVLVIDGEKTDNQQRVIDKFQKQYPDTLRIVQINKNIGQGPALNEGLKHCSHELVARMDTDDYSKADRFEKQIRLFNNNPSIDIASSWVDEFYESIDHVSSTRKVPEKHQQIKKYAQSRCPLNHPVVMFKKSKVIEAGGYMLLGKLDDYVLWMKMLKNGAIFHNIQESLLFFRLGKDAFKRRNNIKYAQSECQLQWFLYQQGMINLVTMFSNIAIRFGVRILPANWGNLIYRKLLR